MATPAQEMLVAVLSGDAGAIGRALASVELSALARAAFEDAADRARGRV